MLTHRHTAAFPSPPPRRRRAAEATLRRRRSCHRGQPLTAPKSRRFNLVATASRHEPGGTGHTAVSVRDG